MVSNPFDLNLRHLRALCAIQQQGSITSAAEAVFLSQPALTQGIAKLERQFGCKLFERQTDGMSTTPEGELVTERVKAALDHLATGARSITRGFDHRARLMTMTQLRAFLALADAGNYVAAAHNTSLSQTAVHRAVGELELLMAKELVERRGRGVFLNAAGKRLARAARLAIAELTTIMTELGLDPEGSVISIGALPLSRPYLVPEAISRMTREFASARYKIYEGGWADLVEPLRDGVIDVAVGALPPHEFADLSQVALAEDRLVIVAGSHHPLANSVNPSIEELSAYPWIVDAVNSPLRLQWERFFAGATLPPSPIECGSIMIIGRLLTGGDFLTLLSPDAVALQIRSGLLARVVPPLADSRRLVGVTTRLNWRPAAIQRRFIEILGEVAVSRGSLDSEQRRRVAGWI
jgi:LysR family transcriptional regulator of gallate degradation